MKNHLKRFIALFLRTLLGFISLLFLYGLFAVILTLIPTHREFQSPQEGIDIYLISNGVHADLCLPVFTEVFDWESVIPPQDFEPKAREYISFGWGEKGFYLETPTWADLKVSTALMATLLPTPAAMHVIYFPFTPREGAHVQKVRISPDQYLQLVQYIQKSFVRNENHQLVLIDCCSYPGWNDNFYEAVGSYHLFNTCNNWTNGGLKAAGIKTATWAPFDRSVFYHFE